MFIVLFLILDLVKLSVTDSVLTFVLSVNATSVFTFSLATLSVLILTTFTNGSLIKLFIILL